MSVEALKDWLRVFWMVLTRPTPAAFESLGENADGKFTQALVWVYFTTGVNGLLNLPFYNSEIEWLYELLVSIIFIPFVFLLFVFCFSVVSKKVFSLEKEIYPQIIYIASVFFVLVTLIPGVLYHVPTIGNILSAVSSIYFMVLFLIAVRALTGWGLWKSLSAALLGVLVALPGVICGSAFLLRLIDTVPRVR